MKIGILGTGIVGQTLGRKLVQLGNSVMMGSRSKESRAAAEWVRSNGPDASQGTFAEAAMFGEMLFNCTKGMNSLDALKLAGAENIGNKILVDVANPLDFSKGMPPTLSVCNNDSLAEQIQKAYPNAKVVKAFNTMSASIMTDPKKVPGEHDIFICGNDAEAKRKVILLLNSFGWSDPVDLGDITNARATEMLLPLWIRLYGKFQNSNFNFKIAKKD